ncbi:hypothetical protein K439DRAFT_1355102 [Ramaria rubella]|nr:hypothetical protein K439DRAFT_1355102 [Ramaria rubella]
MPTSFQNTKKNKRQIELVYIQSIKRQRINTNDRLEIYQAEPQKTPHGIKWDSMWWSCAYDSIIVILFNIWKDLKELNLHSTIETPYLHQLHDGFAKVEIGNTSLNHVCNEIRMRLHNTNETMFPKGANGASVRNTCEYRFRLYPDKATMHIQCPKCHTIVHTQHEEYLVQDLNFDRQKLSNMNKALDKKALQSYIDYAFNQNIFQQCSMCNVHMRACTTFQCTPNIYIFNMEMTPRNDNLSKVVKLPLDDNKVHKMQLRGIIYHGGYHFTARIIDSNSNCWYYDGIETSTTCIYEGN